MDAHAHSPLLDLFRRGEVPRDVKVLAARGALAPRAHEQLAILVLLLDDGDAEIAGQARATLEALPRPAVEAFLGRSDASDDVRQYFASRGIRAANTMDLSDEPIVDTGADEDLATLEKEFEAYLAGQAAGSEGAPGESPEASRDPRPLSSLPVVDRIKLAMRGTREQRAVLVRDGNRLVSTAVLSSPKLTETEVESIARMGNVSDEVLRVIGANRHWAKSYTIANALVRNPKTPPSVSMPMVSRLNERDLKGLSIDRNVPEGLRVAARKLLVTNASRRK